MKNIKIILSAILGLSLIYSCNDLDLAALDKANSESWYAKVDHFRYSLNDAYRSTFWKSESDFWTDNMQKRAEGNAIKDGTVDSEWGTAKDSWAHTYKCISRANTIITELNTKGDALGESVKNQFLGEAYFIKAGQYAYLITRFGDVPYFDDNISIEESFTVARESKDIIKDKVYKLFDDAASLLPSTYSGKQYFTKGAAYAMKARTALYLGEYQIAADAAKACMDLGVYELHPDFREYFLSKTKFSKETIMQFPRSYDFNAKMGTTHLIPRSLAGWAQYQPTWQLLAAFECVDGKPVDESPLFDSKNPFKNRDPRLLNTIVPFGKITDTDALTPQSGSTHCGIEYNPFPLRREIFNPYSNSTVKNNDTRSINPYASFNGLIVRKGIDYEWCDDKATDANHIYLRYAEVLLTYAEAKIELDQIDASVLKAINDVRERGYSGSSYTAPLVTTTDQAQLRKIIRNERRCELALENTRYMDLIRWKLAEKALKGNVYGLLKVDRVTDLTEPVTGDMVTNVIDTDKWFWGLTPEIDDDWLPNFDNLVSADLCVVLNVMNFDASKQYLYPIPNSDIKLNENLTQNPGY